MVEKDPHSILDFTLASFGEWKLLNPEALLAIPESGSEVWETPLTSFFKLKVDAIVLPSPDHIGVGVVLQDDQVRIYATLAKP